MRRVAAALALILLACCSSAFGGTLEKLLSPGDLSKAHAKYESDCSKCHDRSDRSRQTALCVDCHKDIGADLDKRRGLHGHDPQRGAPCVSCHTEHKGRTADILRLDRDALQHDRTGFRLQGKHVTTTCDACHRAGQKFRAAAVTCVGCHEQQDVHKGSLGRNCDDCHGTDSFRKVPFDHDKTRFPLHDAHQHAACGDCHRDATYKNTPRECIACHARDDAHKGTRGPACADCHNTREWKHSSFDHERSAHFALNGIHSKITCDACHLSGNLKAKVPDTCVGCHATEDRHGGRFGDKCADCHNEQRWKDAHYDHAKAASFPLRGRHEKVECHACHTGIAGKPKLATQCDGCHRADDVHRGGMGRECAQCHVETGWKDKVVFDHDMARFPLVGLHASVACEECHVSQSYRGTPRECVSCHRAQDVHKGNLGRDCAKCHNANGWSYWQFDHGTATKFALVGKHARIACKDCHVKPADEVKLPKECGSCHARDDTHRGGFGPDCSRCHSSISWRSAGIRQ